MVTKRAFLAAAGALAAHPSISWGMDDGARPPVGLSSLRLQLASAGGATDCVRLVGPEPEGMLRLGLGRPVDIAFHNTGSEPATLVARGLRGVGGLDDLPAETAVGASGHLKLLPRDAGTSLLRLAPTRFQVTARGGHQVIVVPEASAPAVDRDVVVLVADWLLAGDNSLRFGSTPPPDVATSAITVNGAPRPTEMVVAPRTRLRLRFASASVQRLFLVSCTGGKPMIAAVDGQPCELFAPARNMVPLGPGARYDLLLEAPDAAGGIVRFSLKPTMTVAGTLEPERDLLVIRTEGTVMPARPPFAPLPANHSLPVSIPLETARRVDLVFGKAPTAGGRWTINGVQGPAADKPVLNVRRGETVVLGFANASSLLVPLRVAGHSVRVLHAKDDGWEPYWRDTLLLPPGGRAHVALVADIEGRWPIDSGFDDLTLGGLSCFFSVG